MMKKKIKENSVIEMSSEDLPDVLKQSLYDYFKQKDIIKNSSLEKDLKSEGIVIELDSISKFIDFVSDNLKTVRNILGENYDMEDSLISFLRLQEKNFKNSLKNNLINGGK